MARIRLPKSLEKLLESHDLIEILPQLSNVNATDSKGRYLPWDRFIRYTQPQGLTHEQAWIATKIARKQLAKKLNLTATSDNQFSFGMPDSLVAQLHYIDKKCGGGQAIGESSLMSTKEKNHYLVKSLLIEEAITSSQLEGAVTTRKIAKQMLKDNRAPKDKSEKMIFNNYLLMKKALERKDEPLSLELILELHQIATYNAIDNEAIPGELRKDNDITVTNLYNETAHQPPCYTSLNDRLEQLCEFMNVNHDGKEDNNFIHPLVKAIILHFMIGFIHPFGDGNGRTARALFYWSMLRSNYWLFEYVSISKFIQQKRSDYDTAYIHTETDDFDLTYFIYHQVDIVTKAVDALDQYIENKKNEYYEFRQWIEHSPKANKLKRGQLELLKEAVKEPGKVFTAKIVAINYDINPNTARSYLNTLAANNLLLKTSDGDGKTVAYVAPADLSERLRV